jgi:hypothetical protein
MQMVQCNHEDLHKREKEGQNQRLCEDTSRGGVAGGMQRRDRELRNIGTSRYWRRE